MPEYTNSPRIHPCSIQTDLESEQIDVQIEMSLCMRKPTIWVPTRSDTNQTVQSQKIARSLKFRMNEEEGLYYPFNENKVADQLWGYCEADLRLCFRLGILLVFPCGSSNLNMYSAPFYTQMQYQWPCGLLQDHGVRGPVFNTLVLPPFNVLDQDTLSSLQYQEAMAKSRNYLKILY